MEISLKSSDKISPSHTPAQWRGHEAVHGEILVARTRWYPWCHCLGKLYIHKFHLLVALVCWCVGPLSHRIWLIWRQTKGDIVVTLQLFLIHHLIKKEIVWREWVRERRKTEKPRGPQLTELTFSTYLWLKRPWTGLCRQRTRFLHNESEPWISNLFYCRCKEFPTRCSWCWPWGKSSNRAVSVAHGDPRLISSQPTPVRFIRLAVTPLAHVRVTVGFVSLARRRTPRQANKTNLTVCRKRVVWSSQFRNIKTYSCY